MACLSVRRASRTKIDTLHKKFLARPLCVVDRYDTHRVVAAAAVLQPVRNPGRRASAETCQETIGRFLGEEHPLRFCKYEKRGNYEVLEVNIVLPEGR